MVTKKKNPTTNPKKGDYIMVGQNSKTGVKSIGGLTKSEALKAAEDFRKDVHTIDTSVLKERTPRHPKTKPTTTKPTKQPEPEPAPTSP